MSKTVPEHWGWSIRWQTCEGVASCHLSSKLLLVLDQFEQWLHAKRIEENTELIAALRHCDGEHVQALVLVRDDFWLAASRFMRDLEIRLVEGENIGRLDLFDPRHAKKVLTAFGWAYGALPENIGDFSSGQAYFWISEFRVLHRTVRSFRFVWLCLLRWSKGRLGPLPRSKK